MRISKSMQNVETNDGRRQNKFSSDNTATVSAVAMAKKQGPTKVPVNLERHDKIQNPKLAGCFVGAQDAVLKAVC